MITPPKNPQNPPQRVSPLQEYLRKAMEDAAETEETLEPSHNIAPPSPQEPQKAPKQPRPIYYKPKAIKTTKTTTTQRPYPIPMKDLSGYFSDDELQKILGVIELFRDKLIFRLLMITGRRVGEILQLKVKDINFDNEIINWHIEKKHLNKDFRAIKPIDKDTLTLIKQYLEGEKLQKEDWVFMGYKKNPLTRCRVFQLTREYCKKAGISSVGEKKPHPHHFRHTFAVKGARQAESPADLRFLQMALEHSTLAVTQNYMQFKQEETRNMMEKITKSIFNPPSVQGSTQN